MKETKITKVLIWIFMAATIAIGSMYSGCGDDNCSVSEMNTCEKSEECVLVSCSCCSYEAVSKDCTDSWYRLNDCRPGSFHFSVSLVIRSELFTGGRRL